MAAGWREAAFVERNARSFREEFDSFLPERILDFHVHLVSEATCVGREPFSSAGHMLSKYEVVDFEEDVAATLPRRDVSAVCFGMPDPKYDWRANNSYLASVAGERYTALRLFSPIDDTPETLAADIAKGRFRGLKPYPDFANPQSPGSVEIRDVLPEWGMEIAERHGLIIMLHIPRKARLADTKNLSQIAEYARRYPHACIVIAHIGRAYFLKNVVGNLDSLAPFDNVYIDIAMLNNWEVLEYAFTHFPRERILFGSDAPIAFAPGKSVEINDGYTYVTPVPWDLSIHDPRGKIAFTSFLYEEIRAVKKAVARAGLGSTFVEALFHGNGARLLARA
jgi:hypothetical protein